MTRTRKQPKPVKRISSRVGYDQCVSVDSLDNDTLNCVLFHATDWWYSHHTTSHCMLVSRAWRHICLSNTTKDYYLWVYRNTPRSIPGVVIRRLIREAIGKVQLFAAPPLRISCDACSILQVELEKFAVELLSGDHPFAWSIAHGNRPCHSELMAPYLEADVPSWCMSEGRFGNIPCIFKKPKLYSATELLVRNWTLQNVEEFAGKKMYSYVNHNVPIVRQPRSKNFAVVTTSVLHNPRRDL